MTAKRKKDISTTPEHQKLAADIKANTCIVERMSQMLSGSTLDNASIEAHAVKVKKAVSKKHKAASKKN